MSIVGVRSVRLVDGEVDANIRHHARRLWLWLALRVSTPTVRQSQRPARVQRVALQVGLRRGDDPLTTAA